MPSQHALYIDQLSLARGTETILQSIHLQLSPGELGCLLGPSGCGKTTLLRAIAGFETLEQGSIWIDGTAVSNTTQHTPVEQRGVGMVFQDYALFPHLSVRDNIAFGLHRLTKEEQKQRTQTWLDRLGLMAYAERLPHQLSGGQQQRVALARALAPAPKLLLLDEPFANLDAALREQLRLEMRDLLKAIGTSALLVTHDPTEAFTMADKIGVMHEGQIVQWDSPYVIYHQPNSRFVANFVGLGSFIQAQVIARHQVQTPLGIVQTETPHTAEQTNVAVLIRPDDILHDPSSAFQAKVIYKAFQGPTTRYHFELTDQQVVMALLPSHIQLTVGEIAGIGLDTGGHVVTFA